MTAHGKSSLKILFLCVFLCIMTAVSAQSTRDSRIISPCPGTWGNMQSLVVQAGTGCDVYYSMTEVNPLVLGIAYDGPVMLDQTGNCSVAVSIVDPDGTSTTSIISYTVKPDSVPIPAFRTTTGPVISVKSGDSFSVPSDIVWTVSSASFTGTDSGREQHRGGAIALEGNVSSAYYAELLVQSDRSQYRYILSVTGTPEAGSTLTPVPAVEDIEFSQWNWVRFYQGEAVLYSIDDEPWRQTTKPVYLDRTVDHTLNWKLVSPVTTRTGEVLPVEGHTLFLPAKPVLTGLPAKGFSQTGVSVSTRDNEYQLSYPAENGTACYTDTWYADVLTGDSRGFSQTFTLYYRGIKQGVISGSFIIDKSAPSKPEIITSTTGVFSRNPVLLQVRSDATVYSKVSAVEQVRDGFSLDSYYGLLPAIADLQNSEEALVALFGNAPEHMDLLRCGYSQNYDDTLFLEPAEDGAVLYLVSSLARDPAGNISGLSFYHVVIDDANYYISSAAGDDSLPAGFMDNPYHSVSEALSASAGKDNPRLFISGVVAASSDILINRDCTITGIGGSGIRFTRDSVLSVFNAAVTCSHLRIEKKLSDKTASVTQSNLILVQNGRAAFHYCDILANMGDSGTGILATDSTLNLRNSLVSLQAATYGCAVSCESSDINLSETQVFVSAKTCSGVTQFRNACRLQNSEIQLSGSLVQAVSLSDAYGDFSDCTFTDTLRSESSWALWAGGDSAYSLSGCKGSGFKALVAE
ncbi:MAG: hypothetical protein MJ178_05800 [Treponemataceae bacterium]|nr:hypothetical protein [Treponemataceae bacterium]